MNSPRRVLVEDVSNTFPDIIVADELGDRIDVMLSYGKGTFDPPTHWPIGDGPLDMAVGNFDNTLALDMAVANAGSGDVSVMLNATPLIYGDG